MKAYARVVALACLLFCVTFYFGQSTGAQETAPSATDLAALRAFKDGQPIEAQPYTLPLVRDPRGADFDLKPADAAAPGGYDLLDWTWTAGEMLLDNNWEIVTMRADGQDIRRLTTDGATDVRAKQSADGKRIVFTSNRTGNTDLFLINDDGSGLQQLTGSPASDNFAQWFPQGDRIVFASTRDGNWEIYTMNADGSNQVRISTDPAVADVYPTVSPDGSRIAWIKRGERAGAIWLMDTNGANPTRITTECDYLENLVWYSADLLYADCDIDGDVMNEVVFRSGITGVGDLQRYEDTYRPLAEVLLGGVFAPIDPMNSGQWGFTGIQLSYVIQNQTVYLENMWSEPSVRSNWENRKSYLPWTGIWSWIQTDWTAPVSWIANGPPIIYANYSGSFYPGFYAEGVDSGTSGLARFRFDYRRNDTEWVIAGRLMPGQDPAGNLSLYAELGDRVDVRTAGVDNAGNVENVNNKPPYTFRYLRSKANGQVTDPKGYPIAGAAYTSPELLEPIGLSSASGAIDSYVVSEHRIGVTVTHPAFLPQSIWLDVPSVYESHETDFAVALRPADDTLQDGGFEKKTLQDWVSAPVTATRLLQGGAYAGQQYLFLGQPAQYIGNVRLLSSEDEGYYSINQSDLSYDEDGWLHVLRGGRYQACFQGVCSPTENIYGARSANTPVWGVVVRAGGGRVVAAIKENAGSSQLLRFFERGTSGWTDQVLATTPGMDYGPDLQMGADGTVHLAWNEQIPHPSNGIYRATVRYRERKGGVWSATQSLYTAPEGRGAGKLALRLDADGTPHIFFIDDKLYEIVQSANGVWSTPVVIEEDSSSDFDARFDDVNVLHLLLRKSVLFYRSRTNGVWSDDAFVAENYGNYQFGPTLAVLADGRVALIRGDTQLYIRQSDGKWTGPHYTGAPSVGTLQGALLAAGPQNRLALVTQEDDDGDQYRPFVLYELNQPPGVETAGRSGLVRRFVVPETLHHPTLFLSAAFESENNRKNRDRFVAEIDDGQMITHPITVSITGAGWQGYAVSLLPWQGKEITLTLAVDAVADNTFAWARLDAMQVASWNTPLIRDVAVASGAAGRSSIPIGVSGMVVITGENFLPGASVSFGPFAASEVKLISDKRLEARTPGNLPAGLYSATVTNPGGVGAVQPYAVAVGEQVYLPAIRR